METASSDALRPVALKDDKTPGRMWFSSTAHYVSYLLSGFRDDAHWVLCPGLCYFEATALLRSLLSIGIPLGRAAASPMGNVHAFRMRSPK